MGGWLGNVPGMDSQHVWSFFTRISPFPFFCCKVHGIALGPVWLELIARWK